MNQIVIDFCYLLGYLFAVFAGHWCVSLVRDTLWDHVKKEEGKTDSEDVLPFSYTTALVGIVERSLYFVAFLIGRPEFIAVWLAMKTAGKWKAWEEGTDRVPGRAYFNNFLIGSGFSLTYAYVGYLFVYEAEQHNVLLAIFISLLLVGGTMLFSYVSNHLFENEIKDRKEKIKKRQQEIIGKIS